MTLLDWSIWLVYFIFILILLWVYRNTKSSPYYRYFLPGLLIKIFGGTAFAVIYVYYFGYGDTFLYHRGASVMAQTLIDQPLDYFKLLFSKAGELPPQFGDIQNKVSYSDTYEEWFMVKLLSPISFISFQSYLVTTLFMSVISFFGSWKLFRVFQDILPKKPLFGFIAAFLVPSMIFWGSGVMKDTITLAAINYLIYCLYFTVFKKRFKPILLIGLLLSAYLIITLKAYILLAFIPGAFIAIFSFYTLLIENKIVKWLVGPGLFILLIIFSYYGLTLIGEASTKYSAERIEWQVKGFHSWHTDVGGSTYSLGEIEYTPVGVISKIPAALNVTFFRPYLWEARNPVVLLGALESLIYLVLFLVVIYRSRLKTIKHLKEKPLLLGLLIYCLIFGFAVGFTSYNFGALARYKIPIMSLFTFILLYLLWKSRVTAADKDQSFDSSYAEEKSNS